MIQPRLVIVGAGGHAGEVSAYLKHLREGGWEGILLGHLDDAVPVGPLGHTQVLGGVRVFEASPPEFFQGLRYVTAIGDNACRRRVVETLQGLYGERMTSWTLLHPLSYVGDDVDIGKGSCLAPGAIVTCKTRIGRHCILNVKASVSHDCVVGDFVNLNPGVTICGNVTIGDGAYIGAGATITPHVSVGNGSIIGAGAVVIDDVPANVTAVGVPARFIKYNSVVF